MSRPHGFQPEAVTTTATLILMVALQPLSTDLYLSSLPAIGRDLNASVAEVQLTLSLFLAGFALAQLVVGPLSDRLGRRPVLLGGIAIYFVAAIACALAPDIVTLTVMRFIQAVGACCGVVLGRAIVRDIYGPDRSARMLAVISSVMSIAPAIGPVIGSQVQVLLGWRWNFGLLTLVGGVALMAVWHLMGETHHQREGYAFTPTRILRAYREVLSAPAFRGYAMAVACSYSGLFAFISGSSFVLIQVLEVDTAFFGYCFLSVPAGYFIGTQIAARLTLRLGIPRMVAMGAWINLGAGLVMAACAWSGLAQPGALGIAVIVAPMVLYMVGMGIVLPNGIAGALVPFPWMAGTASALTGFLQVGTAALVGFAVGYTFDGTAIPMTSAIALMGLATLLSYFCLLPRPVLSRPAAD